MTLNRKLQNGVDAPQESKPEAVSLAVFKVRSCRGSFFYAREVFRAELDGRSYKMLAPLDGIRGLNEGCAPVFRLKEDGIWVMERDEETVKKIYGRYYQSREDGRYDGRA